MMTTCTNHRTAIEKNYQELQCIGPYRTNINKVTAPHVHFIPLSKSYYIEVARYTLLYIFKNASVCVSMKIKYMSTQVKVITITK